MKNEIEFIKLEKAGDSFTGNYKGIAKTKNNFWLVFKGKKKDVDYALSLTENLKHILRLINADKELVFDREISVKLLEIFNLADERTYKKHLVVLGNGKEYEENNFNFLEQKDINNFLE